LYADISAEALQKEYDETAVLYREKIVELTSRTAQAAMNDDDAVHNKTDGSQKSAKTNANDRDEFTRSLLSYYIERLNIKMHHIKLELAIKLRALGNPLLDM